MVEVLAALADYMGHRVQEEDREADTEAHPHEADTAFG